MIIIEFKNKILDDKFTQLSGRNSDLSVLTMSSTFRDLVHLGRKPYVSSLSAQSNLTVEVVATLFALGKSA